MQLSEMKKALLEAEMTLKRADNTAHQLADMLSGRLRTVNSSYLLRKLKKELSSFNAKTGEWK